MCYKNALSKGFHDSDQLLAESVVGQTLTHVRNLIATKYLALAITELSEGINALRKDNRASLDEYMYRSNNVECTDSDKKILFEELMKDTVEDEIADTFIRLFDTCGALGIDITNFIKLKMEYNANRERLHGGKF